MRFSNVRPAHSLQHDLRRKVRAVDLDDVELDVHAWDFLGKNLASSFFLQLFGAGAGAADDGNRAWPYGS